MFFIYSYILNYFYYTHIYITHITILKLHCGPQFVGIDNIQNRYYSVQCSAHYSGDSVYRKCMYSSVCVSAL